MNDFSQFDISKELLEAINKRGIKVPTQIQEESLPHILEGYDVIGESATGSGKTLAFGAGISEYVIPGKGLQALVMAPTRELAEQVRQSLEWMTAHKQIKIINIYGGVSMAPQIDNLPTADVVVATPGRLLDHMHRGNIDLSKIAILVLDEADHMFDMGFIDDIEEIISNCPEERQSLFFSATIDDRAKQIARKYMADPVHVYATKMVDPTKLTQVYYDVPKQKKISLLINLLKKEESDLVMVFCNTRNTTDFVVKNLKANSIKATAIHGGLSQNKRSKTIERFHDGKTEFLVCTDVAARGLHIDNVSHVYNYEAPNSHTEYVHRIGRTARAGEQGQVINLICEYDHDNFSRVMKHYSEFNIESLDVPSLDRIEFVRPESRHSERRGEFHRGQDRRNNPRDASRTGARPRSNTTGASRGNFRSDSASGPRRDKPQTNSRR